MPEDKFCLGLLRRRQCLAPTWRGCLALLFASAVILELAVHEVHPFLAVTDQVPGGMLVVEGWAPDYVLEAAVAEFNGGNYSKLFVTGGPIDRGSVLSQYQTWSELGAATLLKLGAASNAVQAVPAPLVRQDRTFAAAVSLDKWLREMNLSPTRLNLVTLGPHARRSRLLFEKALGKNVRVGVISIQPLDYDPKRWWSSSQGVRMVMSEALAYSYVRLCFRP